MYTNNYISVYTNMLTTNNSGWWHFGWILFSYSNLSSFSNEYVALFFLFFYNLRKDIIKKKQNTLFLFWDRVCAGIPSYSVVPGYLAPAV